MHHTEYDTRLASYALVVDGDGRVLLSWFVGSEWNGPEWGLPGGGVEFGESVEEAVVREVREETGYDVALDGLLLVDTWQVEREPRPFKAVRVVFRAHVVGGTLGTLEVGGTTSDAAWVAPSTLTDPSPLLARVLAAVGG